MKKWAKSAQCTCRTVPSGELTSQNAIFVQKAKTNANACCQFKLDYEFTLLKRYSTKISAVG